MLFIILYNMMLVVLTLLMIVTAFLLKRKWKLFLSPILLMLSLTMFIIPNVNYFEEPLADSFKVVVTENGKPLEGVNVITARGLEFTSFFAYNSEVVWRDVDVRVTNSNGEVDFDIKPKFMSINIGFIGNWHDNNDIFYSCLKDGYRYVSAITKTKRVILVNIDRNVMGTGYYSGLNLLQLDKKHIFLNFSNKAKNLIDLHLEKIVDKGM